MVEYWMYRYTQLVECERQEEFLSDCYTHYCATDAHKGQKVGHSYITVKENHMLWFAAQK